MKERPDEVVDRPNGSVVGAVEDGISLVAVAVPARGFERLAAAKLRRLGAADLLGSGLYDFRPDLPRHVGADLTVEPGEAGNKGGQQPLLPTQRRLQHGCVVVLVIVLMKSGSQEGSRFDTGGVAGGEIDLVAPGTSAAVDESTDKLIKPDRVVGQGLDELGGGFGVEVADVGQIPLAAQLGREGIGGVWLAHVVVRHAWLLSDTIGEGPIPWGSGDPRRSGRKLTAGMNLLKR